MALPVSRILAIAVTLAAAFLAGAWAMLWLVDRLFGGDGPRIELAPPYPAREPWGDL